MRGFYHTGLAVSVVSQSDQNVEYLDPCPRGVLRDLSDNAGDKCLQYRNNKVVGGKLLVYRGSFGRYSPEPADRWAMVKI